MKKLYLKTHGCQMNVYDSARMVDLLRARHGYQVVDAPEDADLILLNTCAIREKAQEKVFHQLGRWRRLKEANPDLLIGVGGCVASQEGAAIQARAPYVDVVFGPQTLHRLPELVAAAAGPRRVPVVDISFPAIEKFDRLPQPRANGASAFVSVMEGCNKYCSFCVVPYTRGEEVSRPFDDILTDIAGLADQGVREITLLGQNVNAYRGVMDDGEIADFALLLEYVVEIPGIERIRYTSSHPKEFTQRLIDVYSRLPKLVDHVHLPVQSGSDRVLAAMKRGYTALEYKSIIRRLRATRPEICVASDFIVGFPGESDADFENTMKLVDDIGFDGSFSFMYSPRPGTPAASLPDQVPLHVKKERLARLQGRLNELAGSVSLDMVGTVQNILVEGNSKKDSTKLAGRTSNNRVVNFAGPSRLHGQMVDVRITEALPHSLRGEVLIEETA